MSQNGMPPGPRLPPLVQTLFFIAGSRRFISWVHGRYGDVVKLGTTFDRCFVMVFDPDLLRDVFRASPDQLRAGEANAPLGPALGQRSLLLLDGAEHLRQRKLMLPPFHGQRMRAYEGVMREATNREIDSWPLDEPFALLPSMRALTLDVIMRAVFGIEEGARGEELKSRLQTMIAPVATRFGLFFLAMFGERIGNGRVGERLMERRRRVDELIFDEIGRRREATDLDEREDVLSMLLQARDEDGRPMSDRELRDQLVTLLVAGHETTATGLAWTFDLVLRTPRVRAELERAVSEGDDAYVDAVAKEALRIRPVVPGIGRVVRGEPFQLGEYTIPPGIEINPSIAVIHRRADRYPQPAEFRPERFLGDDAPDTYTWVPFGGGTRRCLGAAFAQFEMRVAIRQVIARTTLEPHGSQPERVERRGVTLVPRDGTRVVLRERREAPEPTPAAAVAEPAG
jgi:cytochrome P450